MPEWLLVPQNYRPRPDKDLFLRRSTESFLGLLAMGRQSAAGTVGEDRFHPALKLASLFGAVLLVALSASLSFLAVAATVVLVLVAARPADQIPGILRTLAVVALFPVVLLGPAFLWGYRTTALTIAAKSLVSVGLVKLLSVTTPWNLLFGAFRTFRVPAVFLLVLDITLKYIMVLGEVALEMLSALRLRSIGRNETKIGSLGGIAGMLFLKSKALAEEVYQAMECRGFTADYRNSDRRPLGWQDGGLLALDAALVAVFLLLGGVGR